MSNEDIQNLQQVVDDQIQENMGMSMIYTIVSTVQEWMQEKVSGYSTQAICHHHTSPFLPCVMTDPLAQTSLSKLLTMCNWSFMAHMFKRKERCPGYAGSIMWSVPVYPLVLWYS